MGLPRHERPRAKLPFTEAFGPTIQGEGPASGRVADFLRFGGCNLSCSWCDSAYTWDSSQFNLREQITMMTADEVLEASPSTAPIMVVTGGEPLLNQHHPAFVDVLAGLVARGQEVHIETNGTLPPLPSIREHVTLFIVSPKLLHAGLHKRSQSPALNKGWADLHGTINAHLKIVVQTPEDIAAAAQIAQDHNWPRERVWVMPEGTTPEVLNHRWPMVCTEAARLGINATHRLHVLAWNDERGH